jgi:toxin HigB-1
VIQSFADAGTADVFNGRSTRAARKSCPEVLWAVARRKLDMLDYAVRVDDLRVPPGNRLELLKGGRQGQHSIRINNQYRVCFRWTDAGPVQVAIEDYH